MDFVEVAPEAICSTSHSRFQSLPYDVLMLCAEYTPVREVLILGTLNHFFHEFTAPDNVALWTIFTERVYLLRPPGLRRMLFNESLLKTYTAVHSISRSNMKSWGGMTINDVEDDDGNSNSEKEDEDVDDEIVINRHRHSAPSLEGSRRIISQPELIQWVIDHSEEVLLDLRMFCDIIKGREPRFALTGLLMALQFVKRRMWYTEVTDLESVRDLLRSTIVEEEHDPGWSVLRTIAGRGRTMPKRFRVSVSVCMQTDDMAELSAQRQMSKLRWKRCAAVAREYLKLREVLRVILAVSEVSDHPNAQQRYDSVWSALRGTTAMLNAEKVPQHNQLADLDELGAAIPMSASGEELLQQIRDLSKATVGGIVSYFFAYVIGKVERKAFLSALFSMQHLAGAEGYNGVPFW
ncbi:hypothetical protein TcYC6_0110230 [Trypanosoma cruzi]|uniref:F-box domain-containing protein n=2 Tax=Trypanosoma cruzi TaxID=5693 RepID=Q4DJG6_TRYCC|nr:hypothetical protein, conserved [Trypanosoma cruzi]EAN92671.1 hypothetical protein, conserved [Trypanosoma cruzi]KAF8293314.1 hypothetical protein TcYC6_0110230 [Trypanosoma cruzi]RNC54531.1 hypothetical protein TcCL_ESM08032 [Trypanosoma cruzi]|eukprot:XP_814522.1 hypothetical protein [Trypanosoma cruzi strain CL Brener]